jgi:hypothetical protein
MLMNADIDLAVVQLRAKIAMFPQNLEPVA